MRILPPTRVRRILHDVSWIFLNSNLGVDLDKDTMETIYTKFGLEPGTQDFIGHAMGLYLNDE